MAIKNFWGVARGVASAFYKRSPNVHNNFKIRKEKGIYRNITTKSPRNPPQAMATATTPNNIMGILGKRFTVSEGLRDSIGKFEISKAEVPNAAAAKCHASNSKSQVTGQEGNDPRKAIHNMAWAGVGRPLK